MLRDQSRTPSRTADVVTDEKYVYCRFKLDQNLNGNSLWSQGYKNVNLFAPSQGIIRFCDTKSEVKGRF